MPRRVASLSVISGILALIFSVAYASVAEESGSQPARHLKATTQPIMYDDSQPIPDQDLQFLKRDLRSQKKQIIAANMDLTDAEAEKFWPVYDRYAADLATIYDAKIALFQEYLATSETMSGDQAENYLRRRAAVEQDQMQLRLQYLPEFRKLLTGREAALFYQIEWRLDLMINLQLAQAPMINP